MFHISEIMVFEVGWVKTDVPGLKQRYMLGERHVPQWSQMGLSSLGLRALGKKRFCKFEAEASCPRADGLPPYDVVLPHS